MVGRERHHFANHRRRENWADQGQRHQRSPLCHCSDQRTAGHRRGALGTILTTTDGGKNWATQVSQSSATFFDVAFADEANGWAVGNAGALFQTTDGGTRWIDRTLPCGRTCNKLTDLIRVRFWIRNRGGLWESTGRSCDQRCGFNWVEETSPVKRSLMALSFPRATAGWASGEGDHHFD